MNTCNIQGVRKISDVSAPIPTLPVAKNATPIASFAPIQKVEITKEKVAEEPKPTLTMPADLVTLPEQQVASPTITSATPPTTPAATAKMSVPLPTTKELSPVHETLDTPPAGSEKPTETLEPKK